MVTLCLFIKWHLKINSGDRYIGRWPVWWWKNKFAAEFIVVPSKIFIVQYFVEWKHCAWTFIPVCFPPLFLGNEVSLMGKPFYVTKNVNEKSTIRVLQPYTKYFFLSCMHAVVGKFGLSIPKFVNAVRVIPLNIPPSYIIITQLHKCWYCVTL
jgi:hypothetical protein